MTRPKHICRLLDRGFTEISNLTLDKEVLYELTELISLVKDTLGEWEDYSTWLECEIESIKESYS